MTMNGQWTMKNSNDIWHLWIKMNDNFFYEWTFIIWLTLINTNNIWRTFYTGMKIAINEKIVTYEMTKVQMK